VPADVDPITRQHSAPTATKSLSTKISCKRKRCSLPRNLSIVPGKLGVRPAHIVRIECKSRGEPLGQRQLIPYSPDDRRKERRHHIYGFTEALTHGPDRRFIQGGGVGGTPANLFCASLLGHP